MIATMLRFFIITNLQIIFVQSKYVAFTLIKHSSLHLDSIALIGIYIMVCHLIFGYNVSYILAHSGPIRKCHCICYIINKHVI